MTVLSKMHYPHPDITHLEVTALHGDEKHNAKVPLPVKQLLHWEKSSRVMYDNLLQLITKMKARECKNPLCECRILIAREWHRQVFAWGQMWGILPVQRTCSGCMKVFDRKLLKCGKCRRLRYCSRECQVEHWHDYHHEGCHQDINEYTNPQNIGNKSE
jgi:hypothetical protein